MNTPNPIKFFTFLFLFLSMSAQAIVITVTPQQPTASLGEVVTVDVMISELGNAVAPSVGAFDIDFDFNSNVLSFVNIAFGDQLDLLNLGSLQSHDAVTPGKINFSELSFDDFATLDNMQQRSFMLASITFNTMLSGFSALTAKVNILSDSVGNGLTPNVTNSAITVVAEPSTLAILLVSVFGLVLAVRRVRY